jgi:hypothetical protein
MLINLENVGILPLKRGAESHIEISCVVEDVFIVLGWIGDLSCLGQSVTNLGQNYWRIQRLIPESPNQHN